MSEFVAVLNAVIPVFGIAVIGLIIRKLNWLTEEADQSLLRVNINLLFPCLILDAALGNPALEKLSNLLLAPLVGFGTVVVGIGAALAARRLHGLSSPQQERTFALSVGLYNYGYVPLPLVLLLFDKSTAGVLFLHNIGVEVALWTIGVMLLRPEGVARDWRELFNPPLLAILLAILMNSLGIHNRLPQVLQTAIHWLGQCSIPMALILIGATVADYLHQFHSASSWRVISMATLLRLGLLPLVFLLAARLLPGSLELKRVMVVEAAMPSAVFPIIMARHYGGDPATALRVVIATSVLGLITIPLWLRWGMSFVGL